MAKVLASAGSGKHHFRPVEFDYKPGADTMVKAEKAPKAKKALKAPKAMKAMKAEKAPKVMKAMKAKPKKAMKKAKFMKRCFSFFAVPDLVTMPDPLHRTCVPVRLFRTDHWNNPIFMVPAEIAFGFLEDAIRCHKPGIYALTSKLLAPGKRLYSARVKAGNLLPVGEVEHAMFLRPCPSSLRKHLEAQVHEAL